MTVSQDQRSLLLPVIVSETVDLMHALMQNGDDADRAIVRWVNGKGGVVLGARASRTLFNVSDRRGFSEKDWKRCGRDAKEEAPVPVNLALLRFGRGQGLAGADDALGEMAPPVAITLTRFIGLGEQRLVSLFVTRQPARDRPTKGLFASRGA
jgi:hypothetical protein